jgi:xylulokinase
MLGVNNVYFLPYLMGERSPINDTNARAAFIGMSMDTPREALVQAVLEGVAFAVRDNFEVARSLGINLSSSMICGGGAQSNLWVKIIANVLNMPIRLPFVKEGPGYGGALLAMVGAGEYESIQACLDGLFGAQEQEFYANGNNMIMPTEELAVRYEKRYQQYKQLYPALKSFFNNI